MSDSITAVNDRVDSLVEAVKLDDLPALLKALRSIKSNEIDLAHRETWMTALQTAMVKRIELHDARILAIQLLLLSGASPTHAAVGGTSAMNLAFEHDKQEFAQLMMRWKQSGASEAELAQSLLAMSPKEQAAWISSKTEEEFIDNDTPSPQALVPVQQTQPIYSSSAQVVPAPRHPFSHPSPPPTPLLAPPVHSCALWSPSPPSQGRQPFPLATELAGSATLPSAASPNPITVHLSRPGSFLLRISPIPASGLNEDVAAIVDAVAPMGSVLALAITEGTTKKRGRSALVCFSGAIDEGWIQSRLQGVTVEGLQLVAENPIPRIFIGNLPSYTEPTDLCDLVHKAGLAVVHAITPGKESGNSQRYGFVQLESFKACAEGLYLLGSATVNGVHLIVGWTREDRPETPGRPPLSLIGSSVSAAIPPPRSIFHAPTPSSTQTAHNTSSALSHTSVRLENLPAPVDRATAVTFLSLAIPQNRMRGVKTSIEGGIGCAVVGLASLRDCHEAAKELDGSAFRGSVVKVSVVGEGATSPHSKIRSLGFPAQDFGANHTESACSFDASGSAAPLETNGLSVKRPANDGVFVKQMLRARKRARSASTATAGL